MFSLVSFFSVFRVHTDMLLTAHRRGTEDNWLCCSAHHHSHADHCYVCTSAHAFACLAWFCIFLASFEIFEIFWGPKMLVSFTYCLDFDFFRVFSGFFEILWKFWRCFEMLCHFFAFFCVSNLITIFLLMPWKSSDLTTDTGYSKIPVNIYVYIYSIYIYICMYIYIYTYIHIYIYHMILCI